MTTEPNPRGTPLFSPSAKPSKVSPSARNHAAAQAIVDAGELVARILGDGELLSLLASRGVDASRLQVGAALHTLAEQTLEEAESLFVAVEEASSTRAFALAAARNDYADFRRAVKAARANDARSATRDAKSVARQSLRGFATQATAAYVATLETLPVGPVASHGFDLNRLNAALARVRRLVILDTSFHARVRQAHRAARLRDHTIVRLNIWVGELLESVRLALARTNPPSRRTRRARTGASIRPRMFTPPGHPDFRTARFRWSPND